jgi:predicted ATP-grasp superfamily ATP-dependent carboligase
MPRAVQVFQKNEPLLLVGASVRAAAWSALRASGIEPWCLDLFADADLQIACPGRVSAITDYPRGLVEAAHRIPYMPWMYTGALENHARVIEELARQRPIWGNGVDVIRGARTPELVAEALKRADLPCPEVAQTPPKKSKNVRLVKPRRGASGHGISRWRGQVVPRSHYVQQWIKGDACSAIYAGRRDGSAWFLGATRQLIGMSWLGAHDFRYCGNIGPLAMSAKLRAGLERLGNVITKAFGLLGFFGVDFIRADDLPWPVEINPRYTASIEVLERASGQSFFPYHRDLFSPCGVSRPIQPQSFTDRHVWGKAILFARAPFIFPADGPWVESLACPWQTPDGQEYADIPHVGSSITKGQPILTLFAHANSDAACLSLLRGKAEALDRRLFG